MDVTDLFKLAFGESIPINLTIPVRKQKDGATSYNTKLKEDELEKYTAGDRKVYSDFGTEVVFPVYFESGWYYTSKYIPNANGNKKTVNKVFNENAELANFMTNINTATEGVKDKIFMPEFRLPNATLVDFSRNKNITKTDMYGGGGTVKEVFGFDDWNIRIRILCITEKNRNLTAQQLVHELVKWSEIAQPIPVQGRLFVDKDIHSLCIEEIDIKQIEGNTNAVGVELQCISEEAIENLITFID